jgi:drug/metabolite transporter (DMT)-like permease
MTVENREGQHMRVTCAVILSWYASNISVLLLNKWLLSSTSFRQPVFLTLCQMVVCVALGFFFSRANVFPLRPLRSRSHFGRVAVLSGLFCITVVLGNLSLKYIPISFNQMIGATAPLFTALFAAILQGAREKPLTYATLVPTTCGIIIASGAEPAFHLLGFAVCLVGTATRALKSVVQAMLLSSDTKSEQLDSMSLIYYMSAVSVVMLIPATAVLEPESLRITRSLIRESPAILGWIFCNACLAYAVNLTNFMVTKHTSALTLQVIGNCKGIVASIVSVCLFHNTVTTYGWLGYTITVSGVLAYGESKRRGDLGWLGKMPHQYALFKRLIPSSILPK